MLAGEKGMVHKSAPSGDCRRDLRSDPTVGFLFQLVKVNANPNWIALGLLKLCVS